MKVGVFSDIYWSIGRVYRDIANNLPGYEFRYISWANWSLEELHDVYNWCDVMIVNTVEVDMITQYVSPSKILFISHGFEETRDKVLNPDYNYAITSNSIRSLFPADIHVWLTPNGVDPTKFDYVQRNGTISKLGWCGNPHTWYKNASWMVDIAAYTGSHLSITSAVPCEDDFSRWKSLSYDEIRSWYSTIDLLLITSIPGEHYETGPLSAFESIMSGVLVIGTPVGNFKDVPGPKFTTIEEAVGIIHKLKEDPETVVQLAKEQYEYVMKNYTYKSFAHKWIEALEYVHNLSKQSV